MTQTSSLTRCAICDGIDFSPVCVKQGYRYVQCARCHVVRQYPYPDAQTLSEYYQNYQTQKSAGSVYLSDAGFELFKRDKGFTFNDLGLSGSGFTGKSILDVGCATGQFLQLLAEHQPASAYGIDTSEQCIAIAKTRGLNCDVADFLQIKQKVDVISMWHLIEHLPKPLSFIEHAYSLLPEGGWLLLETPVIGSISEAFGADWRYYMPVEHINLFTFDTLVELCCNAGFQLKSFTRFGSGNDGIPPVNKRAMDKIAKQQGFGDTLALWFIKGKDIS